MKQLPSIARVSLEVVKAARSFIQGLWYLRSLKRPIVTILGGSLHTQYASSYHTRAYALAGLLARDGISLLTGGGPGIMYSSNCGFITTPSTERAGASTLGMGVQGIDETFDNECVFVFKAYDFCVRKYLLIHYSDAFIFFPGGLGTADEFFYMLDMRKHALLPPAPIFLIDCAYWQPLVTWYAERGVAQGFIPPECMHLFKIEDDINKVHAYLRDYFSSAQQ